MYAKKSSNKTIYCEHVCTKTNCNQLYYTHNKQTHTPLKEHKMKNQITRTENFTFDQLYDTAYEAAEAAYKKYENLWWTVDDMAFHLINEMLKHPSADKYEIISFKNAEGIIELQVNDLYLTKAKLRPSTPIPGYQPSEYFRNLLNKGMK